MQNHTSHTDRETLEVELLVPEYERRPRRVTVADHERFHDWTRTGKAVDPDHDLEELLGELRRIENEHKAQHSRR